MSLARFKRMEAEYTSKPSPPPPPPPRPAPRPLEAVRQRIQTTAQRVAKRIGDIGAWAEKQQRRLIEERKADVKSVVGTVASFVLPTTAMQMIGGRIKMEDVKKKPEVAMGLGADVLVMMPVAGTAAKVARALGRVARPVRAAAPATAQLVPTVL